MHPLFRKWQVIFWIVSVALALLLVFNILPVNKDQTIGLGNGIDYGLDFAGGVEVQLRLETPVDAQTMSIEKGILESRLNSLGLKDIPVEDLTPLIDVLRIREAAPAA